MPHPNVVLNLVQVLILGAADSIWTGTAQVAFVYLMTHQSNTSVGLVEMAYGLTNFLAAYPLGYVADKHGRSPLLKIGGAVAIAAAVATAFAVWSVTENDPDWGIWAFVACMCVWGVVGGITSGPGQALYADSVPEGTRTTWFTRLFQAYLLGDCVGPAVTVALFHFCGDHWHLNELRIVILVGLGLEVLGSIPSFFYRDVKESADNNEEEEEEKDGVYNKWIPRVLLLSSVVVALGSGMTVKFFPLFFKNVLGLSPTQVQSIYVAVPLAILLFSSLGKWLGRKIGRIQAVLTLSFAGLVCLVVLARWHADLTVYGAAAVYVVRTGLMSCTYPVQESILMDVVPKNERARWKSLESVAVFGWCGSAAIGGHLTDTVGYTYTFLITAGVQATGLLLLLFIMRAVPKEKPEINTKEVEPLLAN